MKHSQRKKEETLRTVRLDQNITTANFSPKKKTPVNVRLFTTYPENHCIVSLRTLRKRSWEQSLFEITVQDSEQNWTKCNHWSAKDGGSLLSFADGPKISGTAVMLPLVCERRWKLAEFCWWSEDLRYCGSM